jgi:SH3-like domain-containing protein
MRTSLFYSICLLMSACSSSQQDIQPATTIIDEVKQQFAPDKRVAIFAVEARAEKNALILTGETNLPAAKNSMMEKLVATYPILVDSIVILPEAALEDQTVGIVRISACNIRSKPKDSAELSTQSTLGTPLTIYKKKGDWYYVQTPDGYLGWLYKGGFTRMTPTQLEQWQQGNRVVYLPEMGFSYASTAPDAPVVSDLLAGNILLALHRTATHTQVQYPDGRMAFLPNEDIASLEDWLNTRTPTPEQILKTAQQWMGRPYLWGGTSGKAVDCSGFTKSVFYLNGLMLPRDASQQVHVGLPIETDATLKNLLPGDFLFFGTPATAEKAERVRHVAIYMGDGKIIHSAELVKVESLREGDPDFAEERLKTLLRAKRMLVPTPSEYGVLPLKKIPAYQPVES